VIEAVNGAERAGSDRDGDSARLDVDVRVGAGRQFELLDEAVRELGRERCRRGRELCGQCALEPLEQRPAGRLEGESAVIGIGQERPVELVGCGQLVG